MEFLVALWWYVISGYLGVCIVRFFYWIYACPWDEDEKCFIWIGLCFGYFALIGFNLWIAYILISQLLRKFFLTLL